eukprot:TRINITY_DN10856_c0_g1_i1.p1 TRINITY_DN10856_c0_g1~~TRINITY_DN10856_c0_g1_i1.p1  ORF type:complete len:218 (-),score=71.05 TRINITY_DN10856_c0_g1_i1:505-1158(-)
MATAEPEKAPEKEKAIPKDGQVMISILKDMGITDYEPRVINQMLEFSYRYVTTILEDARIYSHHAKKKAVDVEDVKLSVSMQAEQNFTSPPPRQSLLQLAHTKNLAQLPQPHNKHGLRLPPDRHCLTNCNYKLKRKESTPGFDFGVGPAYRPAGGGGKNNNKHNMSMIVGGKMSNQQAIITTEDIQNGTGQPMFNIQVHPNYGQDNTIIKRKREENN